MLPLTENVMIRPMAAQIGIELSPGVCRLVDLETRRADGLVRVKRVRRFAVLPRDGEEMQTALAGLRGRSASVVVWGIPADHRQVMVTAGSYEAMRREAKRALSMAGVETRGALIDIARAPAPAAPERTRRRPVVAVLVDGAAAAEALRPLRAAGINVETLATPATALLSLARTRRAAGEPAVAAEVGESAAVVVDAWVALEDFSTGIALLRDGALVAARELSWGFRVGRRGNLRDREDVAVRFADELAEFLMTTGGSLHSVRRLTLCGGAPDLRTLAALVTERLGVPVEALDEPFGIEGELHPFVRDRCADMWMSLAVVVDRAAPLNLLHAQRIRAVHARFARAAVAAGIMVGVGLGWQAAQCPLLRAEPLSSPHRVAPARSLPRPPGAGLAAVRAEEQGERENR